MPRIDDAKQQYSLLKALDAIAQGYQVASVGDRYIMVENPDYQPYDGSFPSLVIDVDLIRVMFGYGSKHADYTNPVEF